MKNFNFIKREFSLTSIMYNRVFLYIVLFASLINMTAYGLMGDIITPLIFVLVGVITAYYNKNMLIILLTSLIFSNIVKYGSKLAINMEGFAEGLSTNDGTDETTTSSIDNTLNTKDTSTDSTNLADKINNIKNMTGNSNNINTDVNIETNKKVKIIKEELNNLIQDLESKVTTVYSDLDKLQQVIKDKTTSVKPTISTETSSLS